MADLSSAISEMFPDVTPSATTPESAPEAFSAESASATDAGTPVTDTPDAAVGSEVAPETTVAEVKTQEIKEEAPPEPEAPTAPKVSKSDLALQVARAKKAQAAAEAQRQTISAQQSADLKRLADLEAIKGDPLKVLQHFGHDYKATTDAYVKAVEAGDPTPPDPVMTGIQKEIASLREKVTQYEAREQEANRVAVVKQFEADAANFLSKRTDLEFLSAQRDAVDQIKDVIVAHWQANKEELSIKEAAEAVEEALTLQAQTLSKTQKLRKTLGVSASEPKKPVVTEPKSLSGQHISRSTQTPKAARPKSDEERLAEAINEVFGT
jgi:hypothetical protein